MLAEQRITVEGTHTLHMSSYKASPPKRVTWEVLIPQGQLLVGEAQSERIFFKQGAELVTMTITALKLES
jgi:hypothetical protein